MGTGEQAVKLADKMKSVIGQTAHIGRPTRKTPVLLIDVPEWAEVADVAKELEKLGTGLDSLTRGDVTVRPSGNAKPGKEVRFDFQILDAISLAKRRRITIGWVRCRVRHLKKKAPLCFRCQEREQIAERKSQRKEMLPMQLTGTSRTRLLGYSRMGNKRNRQYEYFKDDWWKRRPVKIQNRRRKLQH